MKKSALLILGLSLTIISLSLVRTFISNNISTSGVVMDTIQNKVDKYKLENSILAEKVYTLSSLTNISQKAYDQGYKENVSDLVLSQKQTVAINR
jgi:hypothetical protein